MQDKQLEHIAKFNAQAGSDVIPLPIVGREGDYRLNKWSWQKLDWRKIEKRVFNLQKRIYKATKAGQPSRAIKAKLLKKQKGICPVCGGLFKSEDLTEAHHVKAKAEGGEDKYPNLALLIWRCQGQLHAANVGSSKKKNAKKNNKKKGLFARIKGRIFGDVP